MLMENHNFLWENHRFLWAIFDSYVKLPESKQNTHGGFMWVKQCHNLSTKARLMDRYKPFPNGWFTIVLPTFMDFVADISFNADYLVGFWILFFHFFSNSKIMLGIELI